MKRSSGGKVPRRRTAVATAPTAPETASHELVRRLSDGLADGVDLVVRQKRSQWCEGRQSLPSPSDADAIIAKYSNLNALVSGGVSLVPGPWGMAAAIPEIVLVVRNQAAMICDLAAAQGKQTMISKELVLGILLSSSGIVGIGLLTIHGGKVVVRRASLRVLQKIIAYLGGEITQRLLRSMLSKWLPLVGAVAMATWARISTSRLGDHAKSILSRSIEFQGELSEEGLTHVPEASTAPRLTELRIRALANLMKVDRQIRNEELEFVSEIIVEGDLPPETAEALRAKLQRPDPVAVAYDDFDGHPEESLALLVDLVALSRRDGEFHPAERAYVRQVGELLGCNVADLQALLGEISTQEEG